jgi:hypothetical protein
LFGSSESGWVGAWIQAGKSVYQIIRIYIVFEIKFKFGDKQTNGKEVGMKRNIWG